MVVKLAVKFNMVVIPFGGGTSVSGASSCPNGELRPIIAIDTSKMVNYRVGSLLSSIT